MVGVIIEALVHMCGFSVDAGSDSSTGVSPCHCVEKGNRSVVHLFHGEINVLLDRIEMAMEIEVAKVRSCMADMAVFTYLCHHLEDGVWCTISLTCQIPKFARIVLTGEPISQIFACKMCIIKKLRYWKNSKHLQKEMSQNSETALT